MFEWTRRELDSMKATEEERAAVKEVFNKLMQYRNQSFITYHEKTDGTIAYGTKHFARKVSIATAQYEKFLMFSPGPHVLSFDHPSLWFIELRRKFGEDLGKALTAALVGPSPKKPEETSTKKTRRDMAGRQIVVYHETKATSK